MQPPRPFTMPPGTNGLAGITVLVASLLLGSCGTRGEGERLRARPGMESRAVERSAQFGSKGS